MSHAGEGTRDARAAGRLGLQELVEAVTVGARAGGEGRRVLDVAHGCHVGDLVHLPLYCKWATLSKGWVFVFPMRALRNVTMTGGRAIMGCLRRLHASLRPLSTGDPMHGCSCEICRSGRQDVGRNCLCEFWGNWHGAGSVLTEARMHVLSLRSGWAVGALARMRA